MKISTRIISGFVVLSVLALACGWAGYYGVSALSSSLKFISGPAWDTADGSMEGTIGVELQMLGVNRIVTKTGDQQAALNMITHGKEMADEALHRMVSAGLLEETEAGKVKNATSEYNAAREELFSAYKEYSQVNDRLSANFYQFQKLMEQSEELGDGAVEELRLSPGKSISWNSGLKIKWTAADGAMESQIGMLQRSYYYGRLINNLDQQGSLNGLTKAQEFLSESIEEIIGHPLYKKETVKKGVFEGMRYSDALQKAYSQHKSDFSEAVEKYLAFRSAQIKYNNVADKFISYLEKVEETGDGKVENEQQNISSTISTSYSLVFITVLLSFAISIFAGGWIVASIVRPMRQVMHAMQDVAEGDGDLTQRLSYQGKDEIGQTVSAFNKFIEKIQQVIIEVRGGVYSMKHSADEISAGNVNLSQRTEEQASSLEETASSMEEMTSTVKQNADNASQANKLAEGARDQAEKGGNVVSDAVSAMSEINKSSRKIADIISVIDEIAFQTNLLALNAAVEAARAGDQGRGFAVVAGEVRALAQRSAEAAKEIKDLIQDSVEKVDQGTNMVNRSGEALEEIVTSVKRVSDIVSEIAAASQEQSAGIDQVNQAVLQMDEMTQQNSALVEEAAAASKSMEEQAYRLQEQICFFKLGDDDKAFSIGRLKPQHVISTSKEERRSPGRPFEQSDKSESVENETKHHNAVVGHSKTGTYDSADWDEF